MNIKSINEKLDFYEDLISLNDIRIKSFTKNAGVMDDMLGSNILSSLRGFWSKEMGNDPAKSLANLFINGAIKTVIGGPLGWIVGIALTAFGIDFWGMLESVYKMIKPDVDAGIAVSSDKINGVVDSVVGTKSANSSSGDLLKTAGIVPKTLISKIMSFIMRAALSGAALGAGVGVARKLDIIPSKEEMQKPSAPPSIQSKQTKFKVRPDYSDIAEPKPWVENTINNENSIQSMLVNFAKDVYDGLNGFESKIISSPAFQAVKDSVAWGNHSATGDSIVIIPEMYKSKKNLVDYFIDDVAK